MATPVGLLSAPFSCNKVAAQRRNKTLITYRALRPERRAQLRRQAQHAGSSNTSGRRQKCLRIACQVAQGTPQSVPAGSVSLVLLAGGVGKRMGAAIPKQYLELNGQPIATYSLRTFAAMPQVREVVVVCEPDWREVFQACYATLPRQLPLKFALPGAERQDSVYNGFQVIDAAAELVAIHDSARPLIAPKDAVQCFLDALKVGAAVLGVPVKPTIKEVDGERRVVKTLQRAKLWEVQTPQVIRPALLRTGFELVKREGLEVTDDVSIIEALGEPVQITPGSYTNIKVTTPDDMQVAERFMEEAQAAAAEAAFAAA